MLSIVEDYKKNCLNCSYRKECPLFFKYPEVKKGSVRAGCAIRVAFKGEPHILLEANVRKEFFIIGEN